MMSDKSEIKKPRRPGVRVGVQKKTIDIYDLMKLNCQSNYLNPVYA